MQSDAIPDDLKFWFDCNVALKGMAIEAIAAQPKDEGPTRSRSQAMRLINKAKADVAAMEREAMQNGGVSWQIQ